MFGKKIAFIAFFVALAFSALLIGLRPMPVFDYDFESFFPQEDEELAFYQSFRERFENDNDYLLIALGRTEGVFDSAFLANAWQVHQSLEKLDRVEAVFSLLTAEEPLLSPFGVRYKKVLDWESGPAVLEASRQKIEQSSQWKENLISADGDYLLLLLKNEQKISKEAGDELFEHIDQVLKDSGIALVHTAGKIRAQGEFVALLQQEFAFFLGISFLLIIVLLWLTFRSWWGVAIPLLVIALGVLWTLAIMLLSGKALDVLTVMQPTVLAVIGLASLIHFLNHFLTYLRQGLSSDLAIQKAFSRLFLAVSLTCLTTAVGFLSLYFTNVPNLKFFGLYTGIGVVMMFLSVISLTPAFLYLLPARIFLAQTQRKDVWQDFLRRNFLLTLKFRKPVVWTFSLLSILALALVFQLKIDGYILDNLPERHPLLEDFRFFDQNFGGSKPLEIALEAGPSAASLMDYEVLKEIDKLEAFVRQTFGSGVINSPLSLVKWLNKAQNGGQEKAFLLPSKGQFLRMEPLLPRAVDRFPIKVLDEGQKWGRLSSRTEDMGSHRAGEMKEKLLDFAQNELDTSLLQVRLTGTSHLIDLSHENVSTQLAKGLGLAFLFVALLTGILFRSVRMAFLVLLPNLIPLLWMAGLMWALDIELKLTTAIIFTVAFGIAVDDTIHFMAKLFSEIAQGRSMLYAIKRTYLETGKAIVLSTLILVSGFSVLMLSKFGVTFYAGLLISLALVFALLADLFLLPLLLLGLHRLERGK